MQLHNRAEAGVDKQTQIIVKTSQYGYGKLY